jgi:hypothetical protein
MLVPTWVGKWLHGMETLNKKASRKGGALHITQYHNS